MGEASVASLVVDEELRPLTWPSPRRGGLRNSLKAHPFAPNHVVKKFGWDEETIAEHDKERGTRQKIEEPNTPWILSPEMSNEATPGPGATPDFVDGSLVNDGSGAKAFKSVPPLDATVIKNKLYAWYKFEHHRPSIQEQWAPELSTGSAELLALSCPAPQSGDGACTEGGAAEETAEEREDREA